MGALVVQCAKARPSAFWRAERESPSQIVSVSGAGGSPTVRQVEPGTRLAPTLAATSVTGWSVGTISEARSQVATISLSLTTRGGNCLVSAQVLVTDAPRVPVAVTP
jgi:hypothetical protein